MEARCMVLEEWEKLVARGWQLTIKTMIMKEYMMDSDNPLQSQIKLKVIETGNDKEAWFYCFAKGIPVVARKQPLVRDRLLTKLYEEFE